MYQTTNQTMYQTTNQITGERRWVALAAVMVSMFFSALDQTIISTAMPTIIGELKGLDLYAWVFTAYMMTSAVVVPIYGKLSDIYGRRPFYVFGLGVFIVGSALAGASRTIGWLIFARGLQGLGGGAMLSMPRATIGDIFNPKERGRWMGLIMGVFGLASIIGPFLGGWITDGLGWRWIFYINLPIGVAALAAVAYALPRVRTEAKHSIDWTGSVVLILGLVPILLGFSWAGTKYTWGSWQLLALLGVGVVFIAAFFLVERRTPEPILSPTLFSNSIFTVTVLMGLLIAVSMFGSLIFLPLFVQGVVGLSASSAGAVLMPMMLSFIVGSAVGGALITRTGRYKLQAIVGSVVIVGGIAMLALMNVGTTWPRVVANMVALGLGLGVVMPLVNVVVQNAFPYRDMGVVNATQQFMNSLGGIIVAPIYGTILSNTFRAELKAGLPAMFSEALSRMPSQAQEMFSNPQTLVDRKAQEALRVKLAAFGGGGEQLFGQFLEAVRRALSAGVTRLFTIGIGFAVLSLLVAFFLKEIPLKRDEFYREK